MSFWPLIKVLPVKTNFRFVDFAIYAGIASILAAVVSLALVLLPFKGPCGGLNCGIDFKGGTVLVISAPKPIDMAGVRATLAGMELGDVQVQETSGAPGEKPPPYLVLARFETPANLSPAETVTRVKTRLAALVPGGSFPKADVVGPKVSGELLTNGILALLVAIGLMLVYIWFRFELQFGMGAVVALFHDVILTFGLIAFTKMEFSLTTIAAILTIIGYSMNDTVVVFDRLRENLRKYKKMPLREVIDLSINETLSRTIITGLTAIMALAGLAVFGGEALFGFSIIMMFGIALGTYSSIYVAAPVILLWGVKRGEEEVTPIKFGAASRP